MKHTTLRALVKRGPRRELGLASPARGRKRSQIRWVTVDGGLPEGLDVADWAQMIDWLARDRTYWWAIPLNCVAEFWAVATHPANTPASRDLAVGDREEEHVIAGTVDGAGALELGFGAGHHQPLVGRALGTSGGNPEIAASHNRIVTCISALRAYRGRQKAGACRVEIYVLRRYDRLVRVKSSITLPQDLLQEIDGVDSNRSGFMERAARQYLAAMKRARRQARDAAILNAHAEPLNKEALDVLEYQGLA